MFCSLISGMNVTSFSRILYWNNSEYWTQKPIASDFHLGIQRKIDVEFWNEVKTPIHIITENRSKGASGPVHALPSILLHESGKS